MSEYLIHDASDVFDVRVRRVKLKLLKVWCHLFLPGKFKWPCLLEVADPWLVLSCHDGVEREELATLARKIAHALHEATDWEALEGAMSEYRVWGDILFQYRSVAEEDEFESESSPTFEDDEDEVIEQEGGPSLAELDRRIDRLTRMTESLHERIWEMLAAEPNQDEDVDSAPSRVVFELDHYCFTDGQKYRIRVYNIANPGDESDAEWIDDEFSNVDAALQRCRDLIELSVSNHGFNFEAYCLDGGLPVIFVPENQPTPPPFSTKHYAKQICDEHAESV